MRFIKSRFSSPFKPVALPDPPAAGVYHFSREDGKGKARIHLRVNPDGSGFILVNASRIYYLNPTATFMAHLFLMKTNSQDAASALSKVYNVRKKQALVDFQDLSLELDTLTAADFEQSPMVESCNECKVGDSEDHKYLQASSLQSEIILPFSGKLTAPYRMDLALTYRCNNSCLHCYNARPRNYPEMDTATWKKILNHLWQLGIPHIIFTGGEPTLRDDLVELVRFSEQQGQITGINTNGRLLKQPSFVSALQKAGLDHIQITIESHDSQIHDSMVGAEGAWEDTVAGIKNALASSMFVMTNTTLLRSNSSTIEDTIDFLAGLGLKTIGLNALIYSGKGISMDGGLPESELPSLLSKVKLQTQKLGVKLIWYTPTQYCHFDPVLFDTSSNTGLNVKGCTAALYNMCVEPDGSVIPCQSYYHTLGNILDDPWGKIWNHELSVSLRERKNVQLTCETCALLAVCGGGCPLASQSGKMAPPISISIKDA